MTVDPNETLALLREVASDVDIHGFDHAHRDPVDTALQLTALVRALDEWISQGGFLPTDWHIV